MVRIAVLVSGGGTNLQALIDAVLENKIDGEIVFVASNRMKAYGLERARNAGIDAECIKDEALLISKLEEYKVDLIVLAGYLAILSSDFINKFENKIINIHPSLLPAFKGKDAIQQAFDYGVKVMGVTVHYVDNGMDTGKIIAQDSFNVMPMDTISDVEKNIHAIEHRLYPEVLRKLLEE